MILPTVCTEADVSIHLSSFLHLHQVFLIHNLHFNNFPPNDHHHDNIHANHHHPQDVLYGIFCVKIFSTRSFTISSIQKKTLKTRLVMEGGPTSKAQGGWPIQIPT